MTRPFGALRHSQCTIDKEYYIVYNRNFNTVRCGEYPVGYLVKFTYAKEYAPEWYNGKWGAFFDNYFHALAYSLKCKTEKVEP